MPINWPDSPTIRQQYTSPNGDVWCWNGYAWDNLSLQSSGKYQGEWVIFDPVWSPRYYLSIFSALAGAVSGDTIYLCTNTSEGYSFGSSGIYLKDNVNINLNGNTLNYTFGDGTQTDGFRAYGFNSSFKSKFQNGTVTFTGNHDGINRVGFRIAGEFAEMDFTGLTVNFTGLSAITSSDSSIDGGSFNNLSTNPTSYGAYFRVGFFDWQSGGFDTNRSYLRNIKGSSIGGNGVLISASSLYE